MGGGGGDGGCAIPPVVLLPSKEQKLHFLEIEQYIARRWVRVTASLTNNGTTKKLGCKISFMHPL